MKIFCVCSWTISAHFTTGHTVISIFNQIRESIEYRVDYGFIINSCYYVEAGSLFIHFDKSE